MPPEPGRRPDWGSPAARGPARCRTEVAGDAQLDPDPEAGPLDGHGLFDRLDLVEQLVEPAVVPAELDPGIPSGRPARAAAGGDHVHSGGEVPALSRDDEHPELVSTARSAAAVWSVSSMTRLTGFSSVTGEGDGVDTAGVLDPDISGGHVIAHGIIGTRSFSVRDEKAWALSDVDSSAVSPLTLPYNRYPTGWFQVAWARRDRTGRGELLHYFGEDFVIWRGSGAAHALDAYCLHLGGNLGVKGQVDRRRDRVPLARLARGTATAATRSSPTARRRCKQNLQDQALDDAGVLRLRARLARPGRPATAVDEPTAIPELDERQRLSPSAPTCGSVPDQGPSRRWWPRTAPTSTTSSRSTAPASPRDPRLRLHGHRFDALVDHLRRRQGVDLADAQRAGDRERWSSTSRASGWAGSCGGERCWPSVR